MSYFLISPEIHFSTVFRGIFITTPKTQNMYHYSNQLDIFFYSISRLQGYSSQKPQSHLSVYNDRCIRLPTGRTLRPYVSVSGLQDGMAFPISL